jgi:hypothetical protein
MPYGGSTMDGIRWTVQDRNGYQVYLTQERWEHILEPTNHPEMEEYEEELKLTIQQGLRRQDVINPQKYLYSMMFGGLGDDNTHIVAITLFRFRENSSGRPTANNYIVTAYQKEIG